ncbi:restriction endonuclease [Xylanibacillus composti]|uniref:Restriction endonuclease type IV Mrr domain-containing protein n=1 Tax=Xylanibacillus composti TaxID=1572762 RepID=A0A8J4H3S9_9BACL|nr:restriction endonuclease [Xylanibacillus composti]MDT9726604.1 restriction endonuclease [Xylanibacillus composti]GIQ69026.1 hypothetical protein XYCOK13_18500 [Xylanibacillus composti]
MSEQINSSLDEAIRIFEAAEANLSKLERLWERMYELTPGGIVFGDNIQYEELYRSYINILTHLPKINGWKPQTEPRNLNSIAQSRLDALEIDEISAKISVEEWIQEPGHELREYRFRFNHKRKQLIRDSVSTIFNEINVILSGIQSIYREDCSYLVQTDEWIQLHTKVKEVDTLLGSSVVRPQSWSDLLRTISFNSVGDLRKIIHDWPMLKDSLMQSLFDENDPIPINIEDLSDIIAQKPKGTVITKLNWNKLNPDNFERLIYSLISFEEGYENAEWLMHTNAPDRGRDLSVMRVFKDGLSGVTRRRVLIQCKHYLTKSVNPADIALLKDQIKLWEPPRIDDVVIATSGRFTADAVALIERHNQSDSALKIEMWPESHLENLLARRPALIAEFQLR